MVQPNWKEGKSLKNATYLTEKYIGQEETLWTPCIYKFLCEFQPELPIYHCIKAPPVNGPWYKKTSQTITTNGEIVTELGYDRLLEHIGDAFGVKLLKSTSRFTDSGDIAGIKPDIVIIDTNSKSVNILENKPYYHSQFDGNQEPPDGVYIRYVEWLNREGIPTRLNIIHSCSLQNKEYLKVKQLNELLQGCYGSVMLEDIFQMMHQTNYHYEGVVENWGDFTEKSADCA